MLPARGCDINSRGHGVAAEICGAQDVKINKKRTKKEGMAVIV